MTNVVEVMFEEANEAIRMISFKQCEETGAKSVEDICEADKVNSNGLDWLARIAAEYTTVRGNDVVYKVSVQKYDLFGIEDGRDFITLDEIDTGRARKLQSKLNKMIEVLK